MLKVLPVHSDHPHYRFRADLGPTTFTLVFRLSQRANRWFMDVKDTAGVPLVMGVPLLMGTSLLERFKDGRLPIGHLIMLNIEDETQEAGADDLGVNSLLLYVEAS